MTDFQPLDLALDRLASRLQKACEPLDSYRVLHGRGNCYPGLEHLTLDWHQPVLLATLYKAPEPQWLAELQARLRAHPACARAEAVLLSHRYLDGAPADWLKGDASIAAPARRAGLRFPLALGDRQNPGFFLDMEPGRAWLAEHCRGQRVLNLFAYTCAFSCVAIQAGASAVVNVDMSSAALARGRDHHRANGQPLDGVGFLAVNILKSWSRIKRAGPYDLLIIDPPSFQKGSFVASRDYAKLVRRIPELMPAGGDILACLNAPELDSRFLLDQFAEHCPGCEWLGRLPNAPDFPDREPERALKLLHFRYLSEPLKNLASEGRWAVAGAEEAEFIRE